MLDKKIKLSDFSMRHFDSSFGGTKILDMEPRAFESFINLEFNRHQRQLSKNEASDAILLDGYAPFCKLLIISNPTNAKTGTLRITDANYQFLRHGYSSRKDGELPVLSRWFDFPQGIEKPTAKYLCVVLYDRAQMDREARSEYEKTKAKEDIDSIGLDEPISFDADYGVVAILGQNSNKEEPMAPITIMRNYMDISMGGSGMKLPTPPAIPSTTEHGEIMREYKKNLLMYNSEMKEFHAKYEKSVNFWKNNAIVK